MKKKDEKIKSILNAIGKSNFSKALELAENLSDQLGDNEIIGEITILKSRYTSLEKDARIGIIPYGGYKDQRNIILNSFMGTVNELNKRYFQIENIDFHEINHPRRTEIIANESEQIFRLYGGGIIRQRAVYSSFSIPKREKGNPIWDNWESGYNENLRKEKIWLEKHAKNQYCKLIIKPTANSKSRKKHPKQTLLRLQILRDFIVTNKGDIDIITIPESTPFGRKHLTIVGNWFYAESNDPTTMNWENTSISSNEIYSKIEQFDEEFSKLLDKKGLNIFDAKKEALEEIKEMIKRLKEKVGR